MLEREQPPPKSLVSPKWCRTRWQNNLQSKSVLVLQTFHKTVFVDPASVADGLDHKVIMCFLESGKWRVFVPACRPWWWSPVASLRVAPDSLPHPRWKCRRMHNCHVQCSAPRLALSSVVEPLPASLQSPRCTQLINFQIDWQGSNKTDVPTVL